VLHLLCSDVPVPSACVILVGLFMLQHCGTRKIGIMFAPIIAAWLVFVAAVGTYNIFHWDVKIIYKISPFYIYRFITKIDIHRWRLLGSVILCVAGDPFFSFYFLQNCANVNKFLVFMVLRYFSC